VASSPAALIIKSHIRGGYHAAAAYLKAQGENEKIRTVDISDPDAMNLDDAFGNMWVMASHSKARKPLHHISINPFKDERLTDKQVLKIVERCEQKYGYLPDAHQRVIVEHIKDGRQHFHVMWNRVSLTTGRSIWPGHHWKKSKQVAREMEKELGLKRPVPKRMKRARATIAATGRASRASGRYGILKNGTPPAFLTKPVRPRFNPAGLSPQQLFQPTMWLATRKRRKPDNNQSIFKALRMSSREQELAELLAWAWEHHRFDILATFGIHLPPDYFEP
jgi:hypothetical protein